MNRDSSIIAQNAGTTAANIVGPYKGGDLAAYLDRFDVVREHVYDGTMVLANGNSLTEKKVTEVESEAEAEAKITEAFGGAQQEQAPPQGGASFKIIEKGSTGQPAPDWLAREVAYQISAGKIDPSDTDLWDNRAALPQFGGSGSDRAPWFRTSKGKVGLWPPRKKG